MITLRNRGRKILADTFIYGQGTSWRYLRMYFSDETGKLDKLTVSCPNNLPTEILRATRSAILSQVEQHAENWTIKDIRKLESIARESVRKIGLEKSQA